MNRRRSDAVLPGCESRSHRAGSAVGVVVVHGFTGTPSSVSSVADPMVAAGFDVEVPRLPGHGTTVDDMLTTRWEDWIGEVTAARAAIAERCDRAVLIGQSMGGTLVLASALDDPVSAAVVCINPLVRGRSDEEMAMIDELVADGVTVVPGSGSDIADPDSDDVSYPGTPLAPVRSLLVDGVEPIGDRLGELTMPLRLFTSRQDHVVPPADSEYLAERYGGPVEHTWLERSFHVATRDFDRHLVAAETLAFVQRVRS